jgi:hypothetical protein
MSAFSLDYFFKKGLQDKSRTVGYFDFSDLSNSGSTIFSGNYFNNIDYLSFLIDNPIEFWGSSGVASFNSSGNYKISGNLSNSIFYAVAVESMATGKENILYSSLGCNGNDCSGYKVSIAKNGYPYIEYKDVNLGTKYFSYSKPISSNDSFVLFFGLDTLNNLFLGIYSNEENAVIEESCPWIANFNNSNSAYFGGNPSHEQEKYFSGSIKEIIACENSAFKSFDKNIIFSGIVYELGESVVTGIISGQTGILYGDVIEIKSCYLGISGNSGITNSQVYSGVEYYVPTYQEFIDFNNESFSNYYYSGVTGEFYQSSYFETSGIIICSETVTGYEFYEYDSGYKIEYEIKTLSTFLNNLRYLYPARNGIQFNFNLNSGDTICAIYQPITNLIKNGSNYNILTFDNQLYAYYDRDNISKISGLYFNGQYHRYSTGYQSSFNGINYNISADNDFVILNDYIFSNNKTYLPPEFSNDQYSHLLADLWAGSGINNVSQTGIASGQLVNGLNFSNSLVFLNGQLLTSGIDYQLPSKIMISANSGYNIISVVYLDLFNKNSIININNSNTRFIPLNENFIEKSLMVWINGVRAINGTDYTEI